MSCATDCTRAPPLPGSGLRYSDLQALADAADLARRLAAGLGGVVEHARSAVAFESGDGEPGPGRGPLRRERSERSVTAVSPPTVPAGMVADTPAGARRDGARARRRSSTSTGTTCRNERGGTIDRPTNASASRRALAGLHARTGCDVTVVFDGADVGAAPPGRRPGVRVLFSAEHEEADAVIVREIAALPTRIRVVVVSSDRWVREHAEAQGAVVVSSPTLLAALHA